MYKKLTERGSKICRACNSKNLENVIDLGCHPLPAEYGLNADDVLDTFPLILNICKDCGLGQIGEYVLPERIFHKKYPYLSSASSTWIRHANEFANSIYKKLNLNKDSFVLELASNDGYLLSEFKNLGVKVIGIEPASNVASIAESKGIKTINNFFGKNLAKEILSEHGYPSLIVANNVFAHIPDMQDFISGISLLTNEKTTVTIENPSFVTLLENRFFDTIYHEHYSYLNAHSVKKIANNHGLHLVNVDQLTTHGGSNRYWLSKKNIVSDSVSNLLDYEKKMGLFDQNIWKSFSKKSFDTINKFRSWIKDRKKNADIVVGYGAAHKGNTFLNSVGTSAKYLSYVVDASEVKQGKFLPGSQIPVIAPEQLNLMKPTDVVILPWNIADELAVRISKLAPNARIWVAQPTLREV